MSKSKGVFSWGRTDRQWVLLSCLWTAKKKWWPVSFKSRLSANGILNEPFHQEATKKSHSDVKDVKGRKVLDWISRILVFLKISRCPGRWCLRERAAARQNRNVVWSEKTQQQQRWQWATVSRLRRASLPSSLWGRRASIPSSPWGRTASLPSSPWGRTASLPSSLWGQT